MACAAFAQNSIQVQAPDVVGLEEQFNVTFVISGEDSPSDFEWDGGSDFQLLWGPQKGFSSSVNISNGKRTKSAQTTYTYILLPSALGEFQLPVASAMVKGRKIVSSSHSVKVVSNGSSSSGQTSGAVASGGDDRAASSPVTSSVSSDDLFLRLNLSKHKAMVGETITATLKLYQRVNIAGFEDAKFPAFNGFWSQETQAPTNIEFHRESVGDKIYNTAVLRGWNLVPQRAGEITVDAAELVCLVNIRSQRAASGSIFDSFFQDDYQTIRKKVSTGPVKIQVSALPAGAPASFGGGVGNFKMSVALTKDALLTHEAASLKVTFTGTGNISLLEAPKVNFPPDFEVYDVKTTDIAGGKVFEFPFIPRSYGDFTIDPVEYSYFDIGSRKYVSMESQPLPINVGKGKDNPQESTVQYASGVNRKDVKNVGSDIRFIAGKAPAFAAAGTFFAGSPAFWIIAVILVLCAGALYFAFRGMASRRADIAGSKNRKATKMARKRLFLAGDYCKGSLYTAFYEELHKALLGFVSDKFNMDATDMTKENISAKLQEEGVGEDLAADYVGLLDACEFARYSPDAGHDAMNAHYEKAVSVISSIDQSMRKTHKPAAGAAALILLMLMMVPANAGAVDKAAYPDSLWTAGVQAYSAGQWQDAAHQWEKIRGLGLESPRLYYNLGNAYFKQDNIGFAIVNYERSLKMDPSYTDARFNLQFAQSLAQDKIEAVPEFFLKTWGRHLCWLLPSDSWAVLFIVFLALTLALVLLFLLGRSVPARRTGFIAGIVSFAIALSCLGFAFWQRSDYRNADSAVVVKAVSSVKSSPDADSAKDLFILHEGTEVKLLDKIGTWHNIELADGRQGWMQSSDLEVI